MFNKKYLNEYRNTVMQNNALKVTLIALVAVILIEGYFIIATMNTQRTIIEPSIRGKHVITDNSANAPYLTQMAFYLTNLMENFTPKTVKFNYNQFLDYVAPSVYGNMEATLMVNAQNYIDTDTSSFFTPLSVKIYKHNTIVVLGRRRFIVANKLMSSQLIKIAIHYKIVHGKFEVLSYEEEKAGH